MFARLPAVPRQPARRQVLKAVSMDGIYQPIQEDSDTGLECGNCDAQIPTKAIVCPRYGVQLYEDSVRFAVGERQKKDIGSIGEPSTATSGEGAELAKRAAGGGSRFRHTFRLPCWAAGQSRSSLHPGTTDPGNDSRFPGCGIRRRAGKFYRPVLSSRCRVYPYQAYHTIDRKFLYRLAHPWTQRSISCARPVNDN